jgi:hypothetical protein
MELSSNLFVFLPSRSRALDMWSTG